MTAGEIVLAYNLPGSPEPEASARRLSGHLPRQDHASGTIRRIAAANPNLQSCPTCRSRSSAGRIQAARPLCSPSIFPRSSPAFAKQVGFGTTVEWPNSDKIVGAPKNDGVTATIKQTPGAIGYIEYGYAKLTKSQCGALAEQGRQLRRSGARSPARRRSPPPSSGPICAAGSRIRMAPRPIRSPPSPGCCSTKSRTTRRPRCCASSSTIARPRAKQSPTAWATSRCPPTSSRRSRRPLTEIK